MNRRAAMNWSKSMDHWYCNDCAWQNLKADDLCRNCGPEKIEPVNPNEVAEFMTALSEKANA